VKVLGIVEQFCLCWSWNFCRKLSIVSDKIIIIIILCFLSSMYQSWELNA